MPELTTLSELTAEPHADVFEEQRPRTVRLSLDADERIPPHTHPGTDVVFHLTSGRLELTVGGETYDLTGRQIVRCSGDRELSPRALEPSTAVVVLAPTGSGSA